MNAVAVPCELERASTGVISMAAAASSPIDGCSAPSAHLVVKSKVCRYAFRSSVAFAKYTFAHHDLEQRMQGVTIVMPQPFQHISRFFLRLEWRFQRLNANWYYNTTSMPNW